MAELTSEESFMANAVTAMMEHYEGCDQCNYGKLCFVCEGGLGTAEDEMSFVDIVKTHACNCPYGVGIGAALGRNVRRYGTFDRF